MYVIIGQDQRRVIKQFFGKILSKFLYNLDFACFKLNVLVFKLCASDAINDIRLCFNKRCDVFVDFRPNLPIILPAVI